MVGEMVLLGTNVAVGYGVEVGKGVNEAGMEVKVGDTVGVGT